MASVMQGDAYNIPVTIKSGNGTLITPEIAACVEITVGQFTKRWPGQVTFDEKTGEWQFPVTQKQTFRFAPGTAVVQARVVFQDSSIMGGSGAPVCVKQSASRGTLPQPEKTEAVTGSAPKATEVTIPTVHDIDVSLHSQVILSDPIKAPYIGDNGNWYEYDAATGTFVDTGTSASGTPPITPETAGKYLTNDGSKAEWEKIESNLFLVHLIQGEPDSDGNTTYTVDKTFTEIKTAYDAGKKVELIPPVGDQSFLLSVGSAPFEVVAVSPEIIDFRSVGASLAGTDFIPSWGLGGIPFGEISVLILPDEKVLVRFPFYVDGDTGMPVWRIIQKLPQQYVVNVVDRTDGTLSAASTLAQLRIVMKAYSLDSGNIIGESSINAIYNEKFYYMSAKTPTSMTFTAATENGLETLTVSNDGKGGSEDVWTHEVVSLTSGYTFCPYLFLYENNTGGYYLSDKDGNKVFPRVVSNQYGSIQYIYYQRFKYTISSTGNETPYVDFVAVNGDEYAIISVDITANYGQGTVTWSGWEPICPNQTPKVTTADNGKFLRVVDGAWAADSIANAKGVNF